jgi:hypothetical protein
MNWLLCKGEKKHSFVVLQIQYDQLLRPVHLLLHLFTQLFELPAKPSYFFAVVVMGPHAHEMAPATDHAHDGDDEEKEDQQPDDRKRVERAATKQ